MLKFTSIETKKTTFVPSDGKTNDEKTTKKLIIEFDAEIFIVPNSLWVPTKDRDIRYNERQDFLGKTYVENGDSKIYADIHKPLVQLWYAAKEDLNGCENLCDHGGRFCLVEGEDIRLQPSMIDNLPINFFTGLNEGDKVTIVAPYTGYLYRGGVDESELYNEVELRITATLAQLKYRYRTNGGFEKQLQLLTEAFYAKRNTKKKDEPNEAVPAKEVVTDEKPEERPIEAIAKIVDKNNQRKKDKAARMAALA